jgi:hypothetical protein
MRNQVTLGGVENLGFIFMPVGSDVYRVWVLNKGVTGYLKGSAGNRVTKNVLSDQLGASSELEI